MGERREDVGVYKRREKEKKKKIGRRKGVDNVSHAAFCGWCLILAIGMSYCFTQIVYLKTFRFVHLYRYCNRSLKGYYYRYYFFTD